MKLDRSKQNISDFEVGVYNIFDTFVRNIDNLHTDDRSELLRSVIFSNPQHTALEFISVFNSIVDKLKVKE